MCSSNPPMSRHRDAHDPANQPLAPWERELLYGRREGEGDVTFTLTSGETYTIKDVRVESVSPMATAPGVIGVEFFDSDRVVHVPFVRSWEFNY